MAKKQIKNYVFTPGAAGVGNVKILDKVAQSDLLLITNTTSNEFLYNFSDPTNQILVEFSDAYDSDFPYANDVSNGVTTIHFQFDTSSQSASDDIQIFVESDEITVRPFNFGTDAIERMRVATPQTMIDADFEYGIQPTKWQTIDFMRGYPSIYEIPGSNILIDSITTDASQPTNNVGASLITVYTKEPHGLQVGSPIRVIGVDESVKNANRAEGSFIVFAVAGTAEFTYYAKGRVGETTGQSLYTTYATLKKGGFYTGANVGSPTFSLQSNGVTGTFVSKFINKLGTNRIAYTGTNNAIIGAPLIGSGVPTGAQITGVTTDTANVTCSEDITAPSSTVRVNSTSGIVVGSALNDGTGGATFVTNIVGDELTLSRPLLVSKVGTANTLGIFTGTNEFGQGSGGTFLVERVEGRYRVDINGIGTDYAVNDLLKIAGSNLGGNDGANDLYVKVTGVNAGGISSIQSANFIINQGDAALSETNYLFGNSSFLANPTVNAVDSIKVVVDPADTSTYPSFNFGSGDFTIESYINRQRQSHTSDEILFDSRVGSASSAPYVGINTLNQVTVSIAGSEYFVSDTAVTSNTWTHLALTRKQGTYNLFVGGVKQTGFHTSSLAIDGEPLTIAADYNNANGFFGYIDETRVSKIARYDSNFTVKTEPFQKDGYTSLLLHYDGVNGSNKFADGAFGDAVSSRKTFTQVSGVTTSLGFGAQFDVTRVGGATTAYTVAIAGGSNQTGSGYSATDSVVIDGSTIGGATVTNDLTITATSVNSGGAIVAFAFTGISASGDETYGTAASTSAASGATFNVGKSGSNYTATPVSRGTGYIPGNQIRIVGSDLGGGGPNDLVVTVSETTKDGVTYDGSPGYAGIGSVTVSGTPILGDILNFFPSVGISEVLTNDVPESTSYSFSAVAKIKVTFSAKHGFVPGNTILTSIYSSGTNHQLAGGPHTIESTPSETEIVYTARAAGTIQSTGIGGTVYPRPDCFYVHRPFDGGVQLGTQSPTHGAHAVRQSKKYIRYQSGKGIMYTTGTLFAPSYDLRTLTSSGLQAGDEITVTTDDTNHNLQVGAEVRIINVTTSGYNGHYTVSSVIDDITFTVTAKSALGNTTAKLGTQAQVSLYKWQGATVRAGAFDDQNGIFWQYDGVNLAVGLRSATYQLAGTISANNNSNTISGSNTRFTEQLQAGDRIVIRGMTHIVTSIANNTTMSVTPDYRGTSNVTGAKYSLVNETIIPQHEWNIDKADGTGPSGYEINVSKMQMIGFQYTWYGAGFIDWMLRGPSGDYLFIHRLKNNNRNTEAFMRSGNLPVRYEVINEGAKTKLVSNIDAASNTIPLDNATLLPESGTLYVDNELINYTSKNGNTLEGATRAATFSNFAAGSTRTYSAGPASSHTAGTGAVFVSNTASPVISHWGSAYLTDGLFDEDRGYIFNYQSIGTIITGLKTTSFLIRLAPSVSNAILGDIGDRELINRAQLLMDSLEFSPVSGNSNQSVIVEGVLNPSNYPSDPSSVTWTDLTSPGVGGQPSFAQIAQGEDVEWEGGTASTNATNSLQQNYRTSFIQFNRSDVTAVRVNFVVSGTDSNNRAIPGGTRVTAIYNDFYHRDSTKVVLRMSSASRPGNAGQTTYTFTAPNTSAAPGETVFSFVGSAQEDSRIDLSKLKELNNTPIGGSGTFPNGPDILAVNVYNTGGSDFTGNFILKWAEAQA